MLCFCLTHKLQPLPALLSFSPLLSSLLPVYYFIHPSHLLNGNYTFHSLLLSASSCFCKVSVDSCLSLSRKPQDWSDLSQSVSLEAQTIMLGGKFGQSTHVRKWLLMGEPYTACQSCRGGICFCHAAFCKCGVQSVAFVCGVWHMTYVVSCRALISTVE